MSGYVMDAIKRGDITYLDAAKESNFFEPYDKDIISKLKICAITYNQTPVMVWLEENLVNHVSG
jgi:hypothetical protein